MSELSTIRIYSRILDCGREEARLWHLARALDPTGSGQVCLTVHQAMAFFGVGQATIYRWLKRGEGVFWYRNRSERRHLELHLIGIRRVARSLNLGVHKNKLGAIAQVPITAIATRFNAKATATYLDALQAQRQAWWATNANTSEGLRKFIIKPWERVACAVSTRANETRTGEIKPLQKYALVDNQWTIPGTTLTSIRKRTDWKSDRTIQRRLSASVRKEHGLEPIDKLRVAEEISDPDIMAALAQSCSGYVVKNDRVYRLLSFSESKFFAIKYCIYAEDIQLLGLRRLRGKVNKFLDG
ncbi:hypothetical protein [Adonisia turfae]|uniref:Helix-turn-helix domain-containing protein n=1 Tax=Adonisia turfae CCMR0081 TaxID=2292702 RepID=A0A6M0RVV4_9CYAN|nr:hypothetical protein [Adonisia turfae]NEZ60385.1 hypothetical protein [Adonisia turfae CCMR0081]